MNGISHHSAKWNEVLRAYYAIRAHSRDLEKQESKSQGKIIFSLLFLVLIVTLLAAMIHSS